METLFDGISLGDITTSMTINSPAAMIFAMYLVVAEKQGADWKTISGTIQNDILKEFIAQKEYIFPPRPSMRLITDIFAFCSTQVPRWNTISVSGYHIREAGATARAGAGVHAARRPRIRAVGRRRRASTSTTFVPRCRSSSTRTATSSRRSRSTAPRGRSGPTAMRDRFGAKNERSWKLRFHSQTAGVSLTAQQPYNNVVRTALQALSAVLGGTNSLHTNSLDEALALPTAEAATLALRTQQIIAHESGVANVVDPLGGSYFVEKLTRDMEDGALAYFDADRRDGRHGRGDRARLPAAGDRRELVSLPAGGRAQGEDHRRRQRLRPGRTSRRSRSSTSTSRRRTRSWRSSSALRRTRDSDARDARARRAARRRAARPRT